MKKFSVFVLSILSSLVLVFLMGGCGGIALDYLPPEDYDMQTLRVNADFEVEVATGVYWVPAVTLGKPNLTKTDLEALVGATPEVIQENIDTLYEALMFLSIADFQSDSDNIKIFENVGGHRVDWEHHKPGYLSVVTNKGCCASITNWLLYLLKGDYEELGMVEMAYKDGSGHVFNYIKQDGKYYFVDLTHYRNDSLDLGVAPIESGNLEDYYHSDYLLGPIHMAETPQDFANYFVGEFQSHSINIAFFMMDTFPTVPPIGYYTDTFTEERLYPESCQASMTILFDSGDLIVDFIEAPTQYPAEWEPYNYRW